MSSELEGIVVRRRSDHSGPKSLSRVDGVGCGEYFMVEPVRVKKGADERSHTLGQVTC